MELVEPAIIAIKTVILVLGGGITFFAYKAYHRTKSSSFRVLSIGFGAITLGAISGGLAHQIFSVAFDVGVLLNSALVAIGLGIIMYSLYVKEGR